MSSVLIRIKDGWTNEKINIGFERHAPVFLGKVRTLPRSSRHLRGSLCYQCPGSPSNVHYSPTTDHVTSRTWFFLDCSFSFYILFLRRTTVNQGSISWNDNLRELFSAFVPKFSCTPWIFYDIIWGYSCVSYNVWGFHFGHTKSVHYVKSVSVSILWMSACLADGFCALLYWILPIAWGLF